MTTKHTIFGRGYETLEQVTARVAEIDKEWSGKRLPKDVRDEWNRLNGLAEEFELDRRLDRIRELAGRPGNVEPPVQDGQPRANGARDAGLRAIEQHRDQLSSTAGDRLERLVRDERDPLGLEGQYLAAVAAPHYRTAFWKCVRDPMTGHLRHTPQEVAAMQEVARVESMRALNITTGSAGGLAVPFMLDPSVLLTSNGAINPLRELARTETIVGSNTWKGISSDGVVAAFAAEATVATDASPTLAQPSIKAEKAFCFVPFSIEVGQDWAGLEAEMVRLFSDAKDVLESGKFLAGTGVNEPGGILNIGGTGGLTTSQRILTDVAAVLDIDDIWDLKGNLSNSRFFGNSTFVGNAGMLDRIFRFVAEGSTVEPKAYPDRGGPLMGRPVREWSSMVNTTTTGSRVLILGDWTGYTIVDRIGGTVELIPHLFGAAQGNLPTGQRGLYYYFRVGAGVTVANSFRYMEVL